MALYILRLWQGSDEPSARRSSFGNDQLPVGPEVRCATLAEAKAKARAWIGSGEYRGADCRGEFPSAYSATADADGWLVDLADGTARIQPWGRVR